MNVAELITELSKLDPNLIVCIADSEWGTDEFTGTLEIEDFTRWDAASRPHTVKAVVFK